MRTTVGPRSSNVFFPLAIIVVALVTLTVKASAAAFLGRRHGYNNPGVLSAIQNQNQKHTIVSDIRGGAIDVDIESSDEEETDDEEEEEEVVPKLAKATKKAATKAVKTTVAAALKPMKKKKSSSGLMKFFKIPYIVKACLNPVVFFQMTAGYWQSLFSINYMAGKEQDSSQNLRNALEQKARQGGGRKTTRGKRKMKPGQAKTLSDLPVINT